MRCGKAQTMISLEMDGMLPPEQCLALEEHLGRCEECRGFREDLAVGSRMLQATAREPSEAFEWTLQLKLNRALQEAAGAGEPWEEERRPWFGWFRSFGLSAAAGIALAAVVGVAWFSGDGIGVTARDRTQLAAVESLHKPAADAGDRRSLTPAGRMFSLDAGAGGAVPVSGGTFLANGPESFAPDQDLRRANATLKGEVSYLRSILLSLRKENGELKALLDDHGVKYLEEEGETPDE